MKIRNGFVSNSSSTSFIVALNPKDKCPHCGRSSMDIMDLIERNSGNNETEVRRTDPSNLLENLQQEIYSNQLDLEKWVDMNNEDTITNTYGCYSYTYKVSKLREWANEVINNNTQLIEKIKQKISEGKQIVSFDIDYHDEALNNIIRDQINNGELEVIDENS